MCSAQQVVLLVAVTWMSSTVAVAPCNDDIINNLSKYSECYNGGKAPKQESSGDLKTVFVAPSGLFPSIVSCVTAVQDGNEAYVTLFYTGGLLTQQLTFQQTFTETYVAETDSAGINYRLYVIRNEKTVYAYYRCLEDGTGTGTESAHIAVGCKNIDDPESLAVVDTAKSCFQQLNITNYDELQPCNC